MRCALGLVVAHFTHRLGGVHRPDHDIHVCVDLCHMHMSARAMHVPRCNPLRSRMTHYARRWTCTAHDSWWLRAWSAMQTCLLKPQPLATASTGDAYIDASVNDAIWVGCSDAFSANAMPPPHHPLGPPGMCSQASPRMAKHANHPPRTHLQDEEQRAGAEQLNVDDAADEHPSPLAKGGFGNVLVACGCPARALLLRHRLGALAQCLGCKLSTASQDAGHAGNGPIRRGGGGVSSVPHWPAPKAGRPRRGGPGQGHARRTPHPRGASSQGRMRMSEPRGRPRHAAGRGPSSHNNPGPTHPPV